MIERNAARKLVNRVPPNERHIQREKYKTLRNRVISSIRLDRKKCVTDSLSHGKNPWHVADRILGRERNAEFQLKDENGKLIEDDKTKAEIMNEFFVTKVQRLRARIDGHQTVNEGFRGPGSLGGKFSFKSVTTNDVKNILKRMKNFLKRNNLV